MTKIVVCLLLWLCPYSIGTSMDCGSNEIHDDCGTNCPPTCQLPYPGDCPEVCISGCFCQDKYIRQNLKGPCIPIVDCQNSCRDNEEYKLCGLTCPPTCSRPVPYCNNNCCSKGCFCKEGYILEKSSQMCVESKECPNELRE